MSPPEPSRTSLPVRIAPSIWAEEVERLNKASPARAAAEREHRRLERDGIPLADLLRCEAMGGDRTRLADKFKVYVPISDGPASERPFGFVFSLGVDGGEPFLSVMAFGERHPERGRSVYERAHKRLHGRYPDQESRRSEAVRSRPQARTSGHGLRATQQRGGLER